MKISVCGKGGCGKSTVTTLLANAFAKDGKRVLVIDGDESNFGLAQMLGKEQPKEYIDKMGGKQKMMPALANAPFDIPRFFEKPWTMDSLPGGLSLSSGEVKVMSIGKIHSDNEGCACIFNAVMAQLIDNLQLGEDDVVLVDTEAGIEHFGRGTDNSVDLLLMVVDPTAESMKLADKVHEIAKHMGKPLLYALNKVEKGDADLIRSRIANPSRIAAEVPANKEVRNAGFEGTPLTVEIDAVDDLKAAMTETCAGK